MKNPLSETECKGKSDRLAVSVLYAMQKQYTYRKMALNSFLFDLKWFIKYAVILQQKDARWYWKSVKTSFQYLWKHKFDKTPYMTNEDVEVFY